MRFREFKVNQYISLRLEGENSVLYVNNERFLHCKFLLLSIPTDKISEFDEIDSIDEASEILSKKLHPEWDRTAWTLQRKRAITPEVEFWGHCSNLQVWAENNYDTRLLHSNIAFPLLRKLSDIGDPRAELIFKEEIAKRLESGHKNVTLFLLSGGYLDYFTDSELSNIFFTLMNENKDISLETSDLIALVEGNINERNYKKYLFLFNILSYMYNEGRKHIVERFIIQLRREKRKLVKKMIPLTLNTSRSREFFEKISKLL